MKRVYLPKIEQKYDFNGGFKSCCKTLKRRVRKDYDAVVAITGEEGVGKSTLANQIGFVVDKNYSIEHNILYSPNKDKIKEKILGLPRFSAVNADEAIKILYKQQWYTPLQIFINTFYRLCRQENKISILCMPKFADFNEGFRNHRIILWIHLLGRGIGIAFQKDWSPFAKDLWWFKENQKLVEKYRKRKKFGDFNLKKKISVLQKSVNFLDIITFPDLNEEDRIFYKKIASKHKYEGLDEEYQRAVQKSKLIDKYQGIVKKSITHLLEDGLNQKDVAKKLGISPDMVSKYKKKIEEESTIYN